MKRDTLKTLAGLLIIGVIVVATFMYGNAQRQAQLKRDEAAKKTQEAKASEPKTAALPSASAQPSTTQTTKSNTAPVQSPAQNTVQGGAKATTAPAPAATPSTAPKPGVVAGATAPGATPLPQAGSPMTGMVGVLAIIFAMVLMRHSKKNLLAAVRTPR